MAREIINLTESNPMYEEIVKSRKPENLVIVAKGKPNRKAKIIPPVAVKNDIYFYVAYNAEDKIMFPSKYSAEDVYTAKVNTIANARIGNMFEIVGGKGHKLEDYEFTTDEDLPQMTVITNVSMANGAGILCCEEYLKKVKEKIGGGYYILPSSIHELIIVPESCGNQEDLTAMVQSVNRTQVEEEDILGDRAYKVDEWI